MIRSDIDDIRDLRDNVSFLTRLAAGGSGRPAPMAPLLAAFGLIYGALCLLDYLCLKLIGAGAIDLAGYRAVVVPASYIGHAAFLLCFAGWAVWAVRTRDRAAPVNVWASAGWTIAALALAATIASFAIFGSRNQNFTVLALLPSVVMALYAAPCWIAGAVTGRPWLRVVAVASLIFAMVWAAALSTHALMLVAGFWLVGAVGVPGVVLWRVPERRA